MIIITYLNRYFFDSIMKWILGMTLLIVLLVSGCATMPQETQKSTQPTENSATAIFAGGCFWCMEGPFEAEEGVIDVVAGYTGGDLENPTYEEVSSGQTQHREGIKVTYDPSIISYEQLVQIYFWQIDPTDPNGQFADKGFHYTTAIYYFNEEQQQIALAKIKEIDDSKKFEKSVVTKVLPAKEFYLAENYHQDYYKKQSGSYNTYALLSGRKGFIKKFWSKEQ